MVIHLLAVLKALVHLKDSIILVNVASTVYNPQYGPLLCITRGGYSGRVGVK